MATIRTIMRVLVAKGRMMYPLDVNNAFLQGELDEKVYMQMAKGVSKPDIKFVDWEIRYMVSSTLAENGSVNLKTPLYLLAVLS